jgi:hypothetical protein
MQQNKKTKRRFIMKASKDSKIRSYEPTGIRKVQAAPSIIDDSKMKLIKLMKKTCRSIHHMSFEDGSLTVIFKGGKNSKYIKNKGNILVLKTHESKHFNPDLIKIDVFEDEELDVQKAS